MSKRFYLATRKDRATEADAISNKLRDYGWERTFTWRDQAQGGSESHADLAQAELRAVGEADVLIVMLPGGYGTHVEIGAALALGKPVILHAPDQKTLETPYPCVFHYHPGIKLLVSETLKIDELLSQLSSYV
jgi:nucleoside 2-deoxyribosyltransferase